VVNQNVQPVALMEISDDELLTRVEGILGRRQEPDDE